MEPSTRDCAEREAAITALAAEIRAELEVAASRMFAQRKPLPWVSQYICQDAVEQALRGAVGVLRELGLEGAALLDIPAEELSPLWTVHLRASLDESRRGAPRVAQLQYDTIKALAGSAHAAIKQGSRHRHFLQYGPPTGVAEFPALVSLEKAKTLPMPLALAGHSAAAGTRFQAYASHAAAQRRKPSARSTWRQLPPDTSSPSLYT
jgi:hypothetical protein